MFPPTLGSPLLVVVFTLMSSNVPKDGMVKIHEMTDFLGCFSLTFPYWWRWNYICVLKGREMFISMTESSNAGITEILLLYTWGFHVLKMKAFLGSVCGWFWFCYWSSIKNCAFEYVFSTWMHITSAWGYSSRCCVAAMHLFTAGQKIFQGFLVLWGSTPAKWESVFTVENVIIWPSV